MAPAAKPERDRAGKVVPGPDRVRVEVLDQAAAQRAGSSGPLLSVARADGSTSAGRASVEVDYSAFRYRFGGDWASRLRLVALPACAAVTPERPECQRGEVLPSRNLVKEGRLSADVSVTGTASLLAVTAGMSGSSGSYAASPLAASASWHAGGSSGDFAWSYPLDTPDGVGGPEPDLALGYSSGSVDGRTAGSNNQSSWVGEGWDLTDGYIERRYKSCADDVTTTPKPGDECWETDNAFMVLGGQATDLVKDAATGVWHTRDDDGARVQRLTGATNGDNDGEHWKVTLPDGSQYFFGLNRLPGWVSGKPETKSVWTVPVFGNDAGEPCHGSTFATSYCTQAWRWSLDYVVDRHGNVMSYYYATETNYYGRNLTSSAGTSYVRGGYLDRIEYGQRSDTVYTTPAPMRVVFTPEERCAAGVTCGTEAITSTTAKNWPDTPYDLNCASGASCSNYSPSYWTRKRLAGVTTQVYTGGGYQDVDGWAFGYQWRDPGDGTGAALWLASITATGRAGGSASLPAVTFEGVQMENRVDALEGIPAMIKWRLSDVYDESGGHLRVNYSAKDCTRADLPTPETNTRRCFPQYWTPEGAVDPQLDWFHKYVAVQVLENDVAGVSTTEETNYEYLGGAAWHYDDNDLTPAKYRTWSQWRGYGRVRTTEGAANEVRSQTEALYLRGMDGDKLTTGTRSVIVTDSQGGTVIDSPALQGFQRESITYVGVGGPEESGEIRDPWISAPTATQGSVNAYMVDTAKVRERTALAAGGYRVTETQTTFDSYGMPTQVNDLNDTSTTADDECTRTWYARNTTDWLLNFEYREETVGVACTVTPSYPRDAISDDLTYYDGSTTLGQAPTVGDETLLKEVASYSGSTPQYVQKSRYTYDSHGRETAEWDALDRRETTSYTPATGGPVTSRTETNTLGHSATTEFDVVVGEPSATIDENGRRTELAYDPLGRLTSVWLPNRSRVNGDSPSKRYSYLVRTDAPSVVTAEELRDDGSYEPTYTFYDGQDRVIQTQEPAPDGGRVVTDTFYDSRGLEWKTNRQYWNSGTAGTTLLTGVADTAVPAQVQTVYDGAERETAVIRKSMGVEKTRVSTTYGGDRVNVTPPAGGIATTTISDVDDHTVELRQYTGSTPTGSYDATRYTYSKGGELASITDPAGNTWTYTYDLRDRKISETDPDSGTATWTYDDEDNVLTSTDSRGQTLAYTYDALDRKTALYDGSTTGTKRADWTYDTVSKGELSSATRYVNGYAYVEAVNGYDVMDRPLGTTVTIPSVPGEEKLAGSYQIKTGWTLTGQASSVYYPAVGGFAAETLRYGYDAFGRLQTAQTGLSAMLSGASYTPYDEPTQYTLSGVTGKELTQTFAYENDTRRLATSQTDRNITPNQLAKVTYTYDAAGNVRRISDAPSGGVTDTQCFTYDYLQRLTQAWTATDDCTATTPSTSVVGGPAAYWQSWTFDKTGNRKSETNYNPVTGVGTTSTYAFPAAGAARPHTLNSVTTGTAVNSFSYDSTGNTTQRVIGGSTQNLTWDAEGNLTKVTEGTKTTEYVYNADGDRLIGRTPTDVTLYLDNTEVTLTKADSTVSATRFYDVGDTTVVRGVLGLTFQVADRLGTATLDINASDLNYRQRRFLPYGKLRGAAPTTWSDKHGYVDGVNDTSTGLTHLGAREYDADTGRFISVDPLIDTDDPQQMNGYAYANNTPVTASDPDGQMLYTGDGSGTYHPKKHKKKKAKKKRRTTKFVHFCDGCNRKYKPPKKKKRKAKAPTHFCDSCDYSKHHYKFDEAAYRRWLKGYKAKQKREAAKKKAAKKKKSGGGGWFSKAWNGIKKHVRKHRKIYGWAAAGVIGIAAGACIAATAGICAGVGGVLIGTAMSSAGSMIGYRIGTAKRTRRGYIWAGVSGAVFAAGGGVLNRFKTVGSPQTAKRAIDFFRRESKLGKHRFKVNQHWGFGTRWIR